MNGRGAEAPPLALKTALNRIFQTNKTHNTIKQIDIYKFASKEENLRPQMCGAFHDSEAQVAVACDSHVLIASRNHYDPEKAGQIISRDGEPIVDRLKDGSVREYHYPRWQSVIPAVGTRQASGYGYFRASMVDLTKAYQNATFFRQNAPRKDSYGRMIRRTVNVLGRFWDRNGEEVSVALKYDHVRLLLSLPQEGGTLWVRDDRRAIYWTNESEGLQVLIMPVMYDKAGRDAAVAAGVRCPAEEDDARNGQPGYYTGMVLISSAVTDQTRELFSKQEKERVPMVKCLGEGEGKGAASVHLHPEAELVPVEGFKTFYTREAVDKWGNPALPDLYKLDSGFVVYCGKMPPQAEVYGPVLGKYDPMTYTQMVVGMKWNEHPSPRVEYFFQRTGQQMPV